MSYKYETEKPKLFTEEGVRILMEVKDKCTALLDEASAFMSGRVITTGDGWVNLAALDYLVEQGFICELTGPAVAGQNRVFVKGH